MHKIITIFMLLTISISVQAQSLMDLFNSMSSSSSTTETTTSTTATTTTLSESALLGKWNYSQLSVGLSDSSSLKGFAGDATLGYISSMVNSMASSSGLSAGLFSTNFFKNNNVKFIINGDGGSTADGSYSINAAKSTITIYIGTIDNIQIGALTADVTISDGSITLLFDANTLMAIADKITEVADNAQYQMVKSAVTKIDGLLLGFNLTKN